MGEFPSKRVAEMRRVKKGPFSGTTIGVLLPSQFLLDNLTAGVTADGGSWQPTQCCRSPGWRGTALRMFCTARPLASNGGSRVRPESARAEFPRDKNRWNSGHWLREFATRLAGSRRSGGSEARLTSVLEGRYPAILSRITKLR